MKIGDAVYIENLRYEIIDFLSGRVTLSRRNSFTMKKFRALNKSKRWVRRESANFFIDKKTRKTITNYEMMALGLGISEINRLQSTLPLDEVNDEI